MSSPRRGQRGRLTRTRLAAAGLVLLAAAAGAQESAPPRGRLSTEERVELLRKVKSIRNEIDGLHVQAVKDVYTRFNDTLSGGRQEILSLYLFCVRDVDFNRKGKSADDFRKWRKDNRDWIDSEAHRLGLQLQLNYLVLTMEASRVRTPDQLQALLDGLLDHIEKVAASEETLAGRAGMLDGAVLDCIFAEAYGLKRFVQIDPKYKWVMQPGKILRIFDRTLLPIARLRNDPDYLSQLWEVRIRIETERAARSIGNDAYRRLEFVSFTLPRLQWQRALDLHEAGDERTGTSEMLAVLESAPNHPEAVNWLRHLDRLLQEPGTAQ